MPQSRASDIDTGMYLHGNCHVFATALHRHTGWPFVLFHDGPAPVATHADGTPLGELVHVAVLAPDGAVWDVAGRHPSDTAQDGVKNAFSMTDPHRETLATERELGRYVGAHGPLRPYEDGFVAKAWADARRCLREYRAFPAPRGIAPVDFGRAMEGGFARERREGVPSAALALAVYVHFGYRPALVLDGDGTLARAFNLDHAGRALCANWLSETEGPVGPGETAVHFEHDYHMISSDHCMDPVLDGSLTDAALVAAFDELCAVLPCAVESDVAALDWTRQELSAAVTRVWGVRPVPATSPSP